MGTHDELMKNCGSLSSDCFLSAFKGGQRNEIEITEVGCGAWHGRTSCREIKRF